MQQLLTPLAFSIASALLVPQALSQQWTHLSSANRNLPSPTGGNQQTACLTADFNGDGSDDILVASRLNRGRIEVWLSSKAGFARSIVDPSDVFPEAGGAVHDIDGDGDLDFVLGQDYRGNKIFWWENPAPTFTGNWARRTIKNAPGQQHHDQIFGDFDGDSKTELVSWSQGSSRLLMFEIPSNPKTATTWPVTTIATVGNNYEGLAKADIDGDGVVDVVGAGRWWKHAGSGKFKENIIDSSMAFTRAAVGQLIPGGRTEVVLVPGDANGNGYWYRWDGQAWKRTLLDFFYHGHTLDIVDLDGDGNLDVLVGEMRVGRANCELRIYYGDGKGSFRKRVLSTGNDIHEGRIADIDGDGDPDIVHKPFNHNVPRLDIWRNERKTLSLTRWKRHLIDGSIKANAIFVRPGDLDGDGRVDAVAGDSWYRNPGSSGGSWQKSTVGGVFRNVAAVFDFDGDGDLDLFGTQGQGNQASADFAWAENDGKGQFTVRTNIQKGIGDFLQGIAVARFGGRNRPLQIAVSWHRAGSGLQMLTLPSNPRTQAWAWQKISQVSQDEALSAGDIDGDGDTDLMLGTIWLENPSWLAHPIGTVANLPGVGGTPVPDRNRLTDIDGDGDLDVVVGLELGRDVVWFENPRPTKKAVTPWKRSVLGNVTGQGFSLDVADFDRDGDPDVVLGEHRGAVVNRVLIFENRVTKASQPTNWPIHVVDTQPTNVIDHHDGTQAIDIDGDGDLDVLSLGWSNKKVWLFENLSKSRGGATSVATPVLTPEGGAFRSFRTVTMSTSTSGAAIHYTLDETVPTQKSPRYATPLTLDRTRIVKARAFKSGLTQSAVAEVAFGRIHGELAYWRFDTGKGARAFDDSRGARHGIVLGPKWITSGRLQSALDFDGKASSVQLSNLDVPGSAMTISAWIRADGFVHLPSADPRIVSKATATVDNAHYWMLSTIDSGGSVRLRYRVKTRGVTSTLIATAGTVPTKQWAHVAAVYNGSAMLLYLDGDEVGRVAKSGTIDQNPNVPVWIGDQPPAGGRGFDGLIDDVRLFARALAASDIRALAQDKQIAGIRNYGRSTSCTDSQRFEVTRSPVAKDPWFAVAASDAPPNSAGALLVGLRGLPTGSIVSQMRLWLDLTATHALTFLRSDATGRVRMPAPLTLALSGTRVYAQFVWISTAVCPGTLNLSGTDGAEITVR